MSRYIDNVNAYLSQMKIKQKYLSLKAGIDEKKLSRILNNAQKIDSEDMERIANALGYRVEFFLQDEFKIPKYNDAGFVQQLHFMQENQQKNNRNLR